MAEHLLCKERVRSSSLLVSTTRESSAEGYRSCARQHHNRTEELGSSPETTSGPKRHPTTVRGLVLEPSSRVMTRSVEPLIRALPSEGEVTDQRIAGATAGSPAWRGPSGPHLTNWIRVLAVNRDLRFRRVLSKIAAPSATGHLVRCWKGSSY